MNNIQTKIGFSAHFHSDQSIAERLQPNSNLQIESFVQWSDDVCLFILPEHLRKKWWFLAARELLPNITASPKFDEFLSAFKDFAHYKGIPLVDHHHFEMLVRVAGHAENKASNRDRCAVVNLGDESISVAIGNESITLGPGDGCWVPPSYSLQLNRILDEERLDVILQIWRHVAVK